MIRITGIGDPDRLEWMIRITGIRKSVEHPAPQGEPPADRSCRNARAASGRHLSARPGNARRQAPSRSPSRRDSRPADGLPLCGPDCLCAVRHAGPSPAGSASDPFDGGRLELSGVFPGSASFASRSAIRRSAASSRCHSARIRASFSAWLRWLRSGSGGTPAVRIDSTVTVSRNFSRPVNACSNYPSRRGVIGG